MNSSFQKCNIDIDALPLYLFTLFIIVILLFWIQFKIRNPFWSLQPVNHHHQFWRKYQKPGIINPNFTIYKFLNELHIHTQKWNNSSEKKIKEFEKYIGAHFLNRKDLQYQPSGDKHISPYFTHDDNAYVSVYRKDNILLGTITNRTLRVHIHNESFAVSYIDYLCVHRGNRKKLIAPELIQTHEYFQRRKGEKKCMISLFKKEGRLTNIVPVLKYTVTAYAISDLLLNSSGVNLPAGVNCVRVTKSNINLLYHFLDVMRRQFNCFIITLPETLIETINKESIHIYTLIQNNEIIGAFFFRETGTYSNSTKQNLECFASLNNSIDEKVFIQGFYTALEKIKDKFKLIYIENTAHTTVLSSALINKKSFPLFTSLCAYYLYNYNANELKDPSKCCFLF
jgi:hypothetical protein